MTQEKEYTLKEAAKILGVHRDSILYWERNNMIPKARRNPKNNYRIYSKEEIQEIAKLRGIKTLFF
ncbi:MerR family transcriptional regulator [Parageobacillus galactosidasius]|jgi:DNA-binding transcriptional MerR regulator|uniref:MerR family DNA-binding transcriptional regulator n=1 Tax=Parageobacillus galactosidasius TaxID=883812 RepID=A0A226QTV1_9BACL|nr:MerR family transcriptional regulator [Parageobacillus galactosidasius]OXB94849.1 MerR family DNA-binding transcriptional regulator [Parageobacillus galactosidasius]